MKAGSHFNIRPRELGPLVQIGLLGVCLVAGHTVLEIARDTLLLMHLTPRWQNISALFTALASFPLATVLARSCRSRGIRRTLSTAVLGALLGVALLAALPASPARAIALAIGSPLVGSAILTQFWLLASHSFDPSQRRRLLPWLAAGGVLGAIMGAASTAAMLHVTSAEGLPWLSVLALAGTLLLSRRGAPAGAVDEAGPTEAPLERNLNVRAYPLLRQLAVLAVLSTVTLLVADYTFKVASFTAVPPRELGDLFAKMHVVTNVCSLFVQLVVAPRVLPRMGIIESAALTPILLGASGGVLALTGRWELVVLVRVLDGGLRHSLHRITSELLSTPLDPKLRVAGRLYVDTIAPRVAQAFGALGLLAAGLALPLGPRVLGAILAVSAGLWVATTCWTRRHYIDAFRSSLRVAPGSLSSAGPLDLESAAILVEGLASEDDAHVLAVLNFTQHHRQTRLVPALLLRHESDEVLVRALRLFGDTPRRDWIPLARRLQVRGPERVRVAALSALARAGQEEALEESSHDESSLVRAHAAVHLARRLERPLLEDATVSNICRGGAIEEKRALISAVADAPHEATVPLLLTLGREEEVLRHPETAIRFAEAARAIGDTRLLPLLVAQLGSSKCRAAATVALVHLGDAAFGALCSASSAAEQRNVRLHIPRVLGRFGTQQANDELTRRLLEEEDGAVRYKVLRGLGLMVASGTRFDRARLTAFCQRSLLEWVRLDRLVAALASDRGQITGMLRELLRDKCDQALERAFRTLKLLHPQHDLHRLHRLAERGVERDRAVVLEYLDALLVAGEQRLLREPLRLVLDSGGTKASQVSVAGALTLLANDEDLGVARLARDAMQENGYPGTCRVPH